jgi:superfamily II DNA helicase RecQ
LNKRIGAQKIAFRFFTVPVQDSGRAQEELNAFLCSHKILLVDRRWVEQGASSFWSFCIDYLEGALADGNDYRGPGGRAKIDYRETLKPEDFAVFARLRDLRKEIAQVEGVPVYTIFTNEQLAQMVQTRTTTKAALEKIAGVRDAHCNKYGGRVLELLGQAWKEPHETDGKPV